jgi:hypothetical protein
MVARCLVLHAAIVAGARRSRRSPSVPKPQGMPGGEMRRDTPRSTPRPAIKSRKPSRASGRRLAGHRQGPGRSQFGCAATVQHAKKEAAHAVRGPGGSERQGGKGKFRPATAIMAPKAASRRADLPAEPVFLCSAPARANPINPLRLPWPGGRPDRLRRCLLLHSCWPSKSFPKNEGLLLCVSGLAFSCPLQPTFLVRPGLEAASTCCCLLAAGTYGYNYDLTLPGQTLLPYIYSSLRPRSPSLPFAPYITYVNYPSPHPDRHSSFARPLLLPLLLWAGVPVPPGYLCRYIRAASAPVSIASLCPKPCVACRAMLS